MNDDPARMAELAAEQLQGSSKSLADLGEEFEALSLNPIFTAKLDELVFECEICNNWFEISEMHDDGWWCNECGKE